MSCPALIRDFLAPVNLALSLFGCGRPDTPGHRADSEVEPSSLPVMFYTPVAPPSLPLFSLRSPFRSFYNPTPLPVQTSTTQKSVPATRQTSSSSVHRVAHQEDLLHLIFPHLSPAEISRCAKVCRLWFHVATPVQWRDGLPAGMYPMLCFLDTFYYADHVDSVYKKKRVWLSSIPSLTSWRTFEARVGSHMRSLTLNTASLYASSYFLELLAESAPAIRLPVLESLRIVVDQTPAELDFVSAFMQRTVKTLEVEVWEPLPAVHRTAACMQRRADIGLPRFKSNVAAPHPYSLDDFFALIAIIMPDVTDLSFSMRDMTHMSRAWPGFVELCSKLQKLDTLRLPLRALTLPAISMLTGIPALSHLLVYDGGRVQTIARSEPYHCLLEPAPEHKSIGAPLKPSVLSQVTHLAVTASPEKIRPILSAPGPIHITVLHINLSACFMSASDVNSFIAAIAEAFPALVDLKICPVTGDEEQNVLIRPDFKTLHPLRRCHNLESLEIVSPLASQFANRKFKRLVSAWPRLCRLILDHPHVGVVKPQERARLSLKAALRALRQHCPLVQSLFLYVSPSFTESSSLQPFGAFESADVPSSLLREVHFCLGYPLKETDPDRLAHFLDSELPRGCDGQLHTTTRGIYPVIDSSQSQIEWMRRRVILGTFVTHASLAKTHIAEYRRTTTLL